MATVDAVIGRRARFRRSCIWNSRQNTSVDGLADWGLFEAVTLVRYRWFAATSS